MISVSSPGNFGKTRQFLERIIKHDIYNGLEEYGRMGVEALSQATPVDTGLAEHSWGYRIVWNRIGPKIEWYNTDVENGANIAILIQYGHATRNGGFVEGRDFINPAMRPLFDRIAADVWKKVNQ